MRVTGRILALAAAVSGALVAFNFYRLAGFALANPDTWDGGRGPRAVTLTVGVFGGGAVVMTIVVLLAVVGLIVGSRSRRSTFWLLILPGIVGLVAAAVAAAFWVVFQPSGERFLAYIAVPLGVPALLALAAGLILRPRPGSAAPAFAAAGTVAANQGRASVLTLIAAALLCAALLLALPASSFAIYVPDRDPATLEEAAQMVRDMQESGASNLRISGWLSRVLDRRITNVNSLERMSILGNWLSVFGESAADKAFGEWRDRTDFDHTIDHTNTANWAWDNRLGQCSEHACTAYTILKRAGVAGNVRILTAPGHEFVVWGMPSGADPNDPTTWGDDARVVDGWLGRVVYPDEVQTSGYFKGELIGLLDDLETARSKIERSERFITDYTDRYDKDAAVWKVTPQGQVAADGGETPSGGSQPAGGGSPSSGSGVPAPAEASEGEETPGDGQAVPGGGQDAVPAVPDAGAAQAESRRYEGRLTVLNTPPLPVFRLADSRVELVVSDDAVNATVEFTLVAVLKWNSEDYLCTATMYRKYEGRGSPGDSLSLDLRLVDYSDSLEGPDCEGIVATRVETQPLTGTFSGGTFTGNIRNSWGVTAASD